MPTTCDCSNEKWVLAEIDDKTLLKLGNLYEKQLSEAANTQCFILRIFQEMFKVARYQASIDRLYQDLTRLDVIRNDLETIQIEIEENIGWVSYYNAVPQEYADIFYDQSVDMYLDLYRILRKIDLLYPEVEDHRANILEKLLSNDSDSDILEAICASVNLIEEIYHEFSSYKTLGDDILRDYRLLR